MKYASKTVINALLPGLLLLLSAPSNAAETTFTPRASLAIASYEFTQTPRPGALQPANPADPSINNGDFPEVKFAVTFKILGIGGTFFNSGYYLDLAVQKSLEEEDTFSLSDPNIPGGTFSETFKGDREDSSITIGRKFMDNRAAIYLGYKTGTSEASGNQGQNLSFEEDGFFIGANYAWLFADKGALSINLAFAKLDGKLVEEVTNPAFSNLAVPLDTNADSDADGLSYGITWSSRLSDTMSYSVGIDARSYTFDNVVDVNPAAIPSTEFEETFISSTFALYFQF